MTKSYWLYNWLDSNEIISTEDAGKALENLKKSNSLRELAGSYSEEPLQSPERSLLAGKGIDFSGDLDCRGLECREKQVDELFRRAWHYFDVLIVADPFRHAVAHHWNTPQSLSNEWFLSYIHTLLYLRKIGAESLVVFREKPPACHDHWEKHASEIGLGQLAEKIGPLAKILSEESDFGFEDRTDGGVDYSFSHPNLEHTQWGELHPSEDIKKSLPDLKLAVVISKITEEFIPHLTSDIQAAGTAKAPLGSVVWLHKELLRSMTKKPAIPQVAFELKLPVVDQIPISLLLNLRKDRRPAFDRFRNRLELAIKEYLRIAPDKDASQIGYQIQMDIIEPELSEIGMQLKQAERLLLKKAATGVFYGAFITTVGLLTGYPNLGPTALVATGGTALTKWVEDIDKISMSNMYFLWEAVGHAQPRKPVPTPVP